MPSLSVRDRERLFSVHRRAVRAACGETYQAPIRPLYKSLRLSSLEYRYVELFARFVFQCKVLCPANCLTSLLPTPFQTHCKTRGAESGNVRLNLYNSSTGYHSFSSRASLVWNSLPTSLKSCKFYGDFITHIRKFLDDVSQFNQLRQLLLENVFNI